MRMSVKDRFWSKVNVGEPDECWEWTACKYSSGYGAFGISGMRRAHRVAYELDVNDIPDGMCVLHHCDNPGCVNPAHLFLGTQSDNMKDKTGKGRAPGNSMPGEGHPNAKLSNVDVTFIKMWLKLGYKQKEIASVFGVCSSNISHISTGRAWTRKKQCDTLLLEV